MDPYALAVRAPLRLCADWHCTEVAVTNAGALQCVKLIHAVGPDTRVDGGYSARRHDRVLAGAVYQSLKAANKYNLTSISIPPISCGIFGFPKDRCAYVVLSTVENYLRYHPDTTLCNVRIVIVDEPTLRAFANEWVLQYELKPAPASTVPTGATALQRAQEEEQVGCVCGFGYMCVCVCVCLCVLLTLTGLQRKLRKLMYN